MMGRTEASVRAHGHLARLGVPAAGGGARDVPETVVAASAPHRRECRLLSNNKESPQFTETFMTEF